MTESQMQCRDEIHDDIEKIYAVCNGRASVDQLPEHLRLNNKGAAFDVVLKKIGQYSHDCEATAQMTAFVNYVEEERRKQKIPFIFGGAGGTAALF